MSYFHIPALCTFCVLLQAYRARTSIVEKRLCKPSRKATVDARQEIAPYLQMFGTYIHK